MAISITVDEVKRKAMIDASDETYDDAIEDLIDEMQPALEYSIADEYLNDTSDANLQAALKLGMLEIVTGEFVEQLRRRLGAAEEFSIAGVSIGAGQQRGVDLIQQGAGRLAPFLKSALPSAVDAASSSTTEDAEKVFSKQEGVW